jgi:selenocysteine-specific elongation factor
VRVGQLAAQESVVVLGDLGSDNDAIVYSSQDWDALKSKLFVTLKTYHNQYPLRRGIAVQEVRSRLGLSQPVFAKILTRMTIEGYVVDTGQSLHLPDHQVSFNPQMKQQAAAFLAALEQDPYSPTNEQPLDPELLRALVDSGEVIKVNESVVFGTSAYHDMVHKITAHLQTNGSITVAEARTMFNSSRKYMLPLLEYLDQQHVTRRVGDQRVLR